MRLKASLSIAQKRGSYFRTNRLGEWKVTMASNETAKMENSKISLDVFAPSHCAIRPKKFDNFLYCVLQLSKNCKSNLE